MLASPFVCPEGYINLLSDDISILVEDSRLNLDGNQNRVVRIYRKRGRYPLRFIKEYHGNRAKMILLELSKERQEFFSKWKTVSLPATMDAQLAYFIGYLQGDGSIETNEKRINFTDEYKEQLERINNIATELFRTNGKVRSVRSQGSKKDAYRLEIGSRIINSYLHHAFGICRGKKEILRIPEAVKTEKAFLSAYLRGIFDADGTLPRQPDRCKQLFIDITLKDKRFIEELREVLSQFGIDTLQPYCRIAKSPSSETISRTWELRIRRREMIIRFLKQIGFSHPEKRRREKILQMRP
jgi:intein/homing endonuclease